MQELLAASVHNYIVQTLCNTSDSPGKSTPNTGFKFLGELSLNLIDPAINTLSLSGKWQGLTIGGAHVLMLDLLGVPKISFENILKNRY